MLRLKSSQRNPPAPGNESLARRLDHLPAWGAAVIGIWLGAMAGAVLAGEVPLVWGIVGLIAGLGAAAAVAFSGEPVEEIEVSEQSGSQVVAPTLEPAPSPPLPPARPGPAQRLETADFVLHLRHLGAFNYHVYVRSSPAGECEIEVELSHTLARWIRGNLAAPESRSWTSESALRQYRFYGQELFQAIFQGRVRDLFVASLDSRDGRILRIEIRTAWGDSRLFQLHLLPWEFLFSEELGGFLALDPRITISRRISVWTTLEQPLLVGPLRVLVVSPLPTDLMPLRRITLEGLFSPITAEINVEVSLLNPATLLNLRQTILDERIHILHYAGHAFNDGSHGYGSLLFETDNGKAQPTQVTVLAEMLAGASIRLVILNAGQSAAESVGLLDNIAITLLRKGIPAVILLRAIMTDKTAFLFNNALYKSLLAGEPIDVAVTKGRLAIALALPNSSEWGIPTLFLADSPGGLFD